MITILIVCVVIQALCTVTLILNFFGVFNVREQKPLTGVQREKYVQKHLKDFEKITWKRMDFSKTYFLIVQDEIKECYIQKYKGRDIPLPRDNVCFVGERELVAVNTYLNLYSTKSEAELALAKRIEWNSKPESKIIRKNEEYIRGAL